MRESHEVEREAVVLITRTLPLVRLQDGLSLWTCWTGYGHNEWAMAKVCCKVFQEDEPRKMRLIRVFACVVNTNVAHNTNKLRPIVVILLWLPGLTTPRAYSHLHTWVKFTYKFYLPPSCRSWHHCWGESGWGWKRIHLDPFVLSECRSPSEIRDWDLSRDPSCVLYSSCRERTMRLAIKTQIFLWQIGVFDQGTKTERIIVFGG